MVRHALDIGHQLEDDALCSRVTSVQALLHIQGRQQAKEAFCGTASNQHGVEQCNIPTQLRVLCDKVSVQCQK